MRVPSKADVDQLDNPAWPKASRIAEMNARGPGWYRENVDTIVDWLDESFFFRDDYLT